MLRQADGGVRHSFYAILFTVRKKIMWTDPPKPHCKVSRMHFFCCHLQVFLHFSLKALILFRIAFPVLVLTVSPTSSPCFPHASISLSALNTFLLFIFHIHIQPIPPTSQLQRVFVQLYYLVPAHSYAVASFVSAIINLRGM